MLKLEREPRRLETATLRELQQAIERKKQEDPVLGELLDRRERLRLELARIDDEIDRIERERALSGSAEGSEENGFARARSIGVPESERGGANGGRLSLRKDGGLPALGSRFGSHGGNGNGSLTLVGAPPDAYDVSEGSGSKVSFLAGKRKRSLKDYIAQVLLDAGEPLSPADIQDRLPEAGYETSATSHRSFYNTVFQALQRYDIFERCHRKYKLADDALRDDGVAEILPKNKTRLRDFIVQVLDQADGPLKVSEIASRVVIAGYETDLAMEELQQRVSATLKKYLHRDFDWDGIRYRLLQRRR